MTTRTMGPLAGWRWLFNAVNLGAGNPRAVLGGAVLLTIAALLPSIVQLVVQNGMGITSPGAVMALALLSVAYSLLVIGPLSVGYLRLLHAAETGAPTRATAIFRIFEDRGAVGRVIGLMLLLMVVGLLLFGGLMVAFGGDFFMQLAEVMQALENAEPGTTPALPPLPSGIGALLGLALILGIFFNGAYAIGMGQVALGDRGAIPALGDGLLGALRNLLPLLVLAIVALVVGTVALLIVGLVVGVLAVVGSLVHPALGILLAAPLYLAAMVVLYVIMFGVAYHMWRDVCGGTAAGGPSHDSQVVA